MVRPVEDKNPVVIGRLGTGQGRPTITFYGHYDVQVGAKGQSWGGCLKVSFKAQGAEGVERGGRRQ